MKYEVTFNTPYAQEKKTIEAASFNVEFGVVVFKDESGKPVFLVNHRDFNFAEKV